MACYLNIYWKIVHFMLPQHLLENCTFINEVHDHNTRSRDNFYVRNVNTNYSQNNLYHNGLTQYNNLPLHVKNCNNISKFKEACKDYIKLSVDIQ